MQNILAKQHKQHESLERYLRASHNDTNKMLKMEMDLPYYQKFNFRFYETRSSTLTFVNECWKMLGSL